MTSFTTERVNEILISSGKTFFRCVEVNSFSKKNSVFIDDEFGEFVHSVKNVLNKGGIHPERAKKQVTERILTQKRPITTLEQVKKKLKQKHPAVEIVDLSYKSMTEEAEFIDRDFGAFRGMVSRVISRKQRHPEHGKQKKTEICRIGRAAMAEKWQKDHGCDSPFHSKEIQEKVKNTLREKFNCEFIGSSAEIRQKIRATNLNRYGVEYLFQDLDFRQKCFEITVENGRTSESKQEKELRSFLKEHGITGKKRRFWSERKNKYLEFDFVNEDRKIAVEMNGLYFHSEKFLDRDYHLEKLRLAQKEGYRLIMIWDYEWQRRRPQVKNFLLSAFNGNNIRLGARKTVCRKVPKKEAEKFLDDNHIQGTVSFIEAFGLYRNEELLMVITVGRHHRNSQEFVVSRMCAKHGVTVSGGFSKLCKEASKSYKTLFSWVDLRLSEGRSYELAGWKEVATSGPDYFYTDKRKIISKQSRKKKNVKTPAGMTEAEHAKIDGLTRVWDCGKKKFIFCDVAV